ncbi:MAG: efflux RND transporter periplasmic adaptor subunit [Thermodesulfobacteriota bacterium]
MMERMKGWRRWALGAGVAVLVVAAYLAGSGPRDRHPVSHSDHPAASQTGEGVARETIWTCAMHPFIRQPEPGKCPICGMTLVPVAAAEEDASEDEGAPRLSLSPRAAALLEVRTWPVERLSAQASLRLFGRIEADETRLRTISAWVGGRIEEVHVAYTGREVKAGEPLVTLYSPELFAAQEELLQARRVAAELEARGAGAGGDLARVPLAAAREKLRLLGLAPAQIAQVESRGTVTDRITIRAPVGGVVLERMATQGMYVETGMPLYSLADLGQVWALLEAYEADLPRLTRGQEVKLSAEAFPGEELTGTVSFVDPVVSAETRTARVRVEAPNPGGRLKPGMFVRAAVHTAPGGPEGQERPLVIPASAPLLTGKRAVVYVKVPGAERPTFEGRQVVLGPRAGAYYEVREGLAEGELVVAHGAFKLDSELQIRGLPSMMAPEGGAPPVHDHGAGPAPAPGAPAGARDEVEEFFRDF